MKKVVTLLLVCMMIFTSTINVFADYSSGTFHYIIENDEIVITNCFGKDSVVEIPEMIAGRTVTKIASFSFTENEYVTKIIVPATVSVIEPNAIKSGITVEFLSSGDKSIKEDKPSVIEPITTPSEEKEDTIIAPEIITQDILTSNVETTVISPQLGESEETNNNQNDNFEVDVKDEEIVLEDDDFVEDNSKKDHKLIYFIASAGVLLILVVIAIIKLVK